MDSCFPPHVTTRPPTLDDADLVAAFMNAYQTAQGEPPDMTPEEVRRDWVGADLAEGALLVFDAAGDLAAFVDTINRRYVQLTLYIFVLPQADADQLWRGLIRWGEAWLAERMHLAPAGERITIQHFQVASEVRGRGILEEMGYVNVRTHYVMAAHLGEPVPAPAWPDGLGVRSFVPGQDDRALFEAGEEAFQDIWNRPPSTFERWMEPTHEPNFDPTLWFLAIDEESGAVAAVCLCALVAGRGEVDVVGVRRPWRKRGLGLALLRHALGEFQRRGVREAGLNVDGSSLTGAPRLYGRAGFTITKSVFRFEKEVRAGEK